MKNKILFFLLLGVTFFYGCAKTVSIATLDKEVSYNKFENQKLLSKAAIYLPDDFMKKMPDSFGNNPEIWPWFFKKSIEPIFEKVIVIKNLDEVRSLPDEAVIIKPELWGFYWEFNPSDQGYQCWLDFKFRLSDKNGNVLTTITAQGEGSDSDITSALVECVNKIIEKFQKSVVSSEKILSSEK